ncbi:MAG: hypothetical protein QFB86_02110 [Patescibacteria group bacterium]|nr:hypothetical protein [Patescibacteria group bacterium]
MFKKSTHPRGKFRGYGPGLIISALVVSLLGSSTIVSFAASTPTGTLDIVTYNGLPSGGAELGNVKVTVDSVGSTTECTPDSGTTLALSGPNHGHLNLTCPSASSGGKKTYVITGIERPGYSVRGDSPHNVGSRFTISAGETTTLSLGLRDDTPSPAPPPPPAQAPVAETAAANQSENNTLPTGTVDVITYSGSIKPGNEIGSVKITTGQGGSYVECETPAKPTDPNGGGNHGHLHILCPSATAGGPRTYVMKNAERDGYTIDPSSPTRKDSLFTVSANKTTQLPVLMQPIITVPAQVPNSGATPAVPTNPATPRPATPATPEQKNTPVTAQSIAHGVGPIGHPPSEKTGSVQVTAYKDTADGKRTRVNGVNIHIQSVEHETKDSADSCIDYNKTTVGTWGTDYGQVHFTDCWTSSDGSKAYQLSYSELPTGLSYKSFSITNGKFKSGKTTTTDGISEQFDVLKNNETRLELNLTESAATKDVPIQAVVTQSGTRFVTTSSDPTVITKKDELNIAAKQNAPVDLKKDIENTEPLKDQSAPTTPTNLSAFQDNAGKISINWDGSVGNPVNETVVYGVTRVEEGAVDVEPDTVSDPENLPAPTGLSVSDNEKGDDTEYGKNYIYSVTAYDLDENDTIHNASTPATVILHTRPLDPNIEGDQNGNGDTADATDSSTPSVKPAVEISSADDRTVMKVSPGDSDTDLSCTVTDYAAGSNDTLPSLGTPVDNVYKPACSGPNGNNDEDFVNDVEISISEDSSDGNADLYGYDGTDWELISTDEVDTAAADDDPTNDGYHKAPDGSTLHYTGVKKIKGKSKTVFTIKTKHLVAFALVKRHSNTTPPKVLSATLAVMTVAGIVAVTIVRRRAYQAYEAQYRDTDPTNPNFIPAPTVGTTMVTPLETERHDE